MDRPLAEDPRNGDEASLRQRIRDLEVQLGCQIREIRALEKIEGLQDRLRELDAENRARADRIAELHAFLNLSKTLAATLNLEELLRLALHLIGRALHVDAYAILLLDEKNERLLVKASFGLPDDTPGLHLKLGEGIAGLVAQTGQAMLIPDVKAEPRCRESELFHLPWGTLICVPLKLKGREIIGVLFAHKPEPHGFTVVDLDLFQAVANQVAIALENAQLYQRTKELSTRDDLTGLFNRRHLFEQLDKEIQRAHRYRRAFSLLLLDLDDFKRYNDTHGHLKGDEALKELACLLLATTRRADIVARFGGEEFVILLPEIMGQGAVVVAEKIRAAVETYPFAGRHTQPSGVMTVTCGVAAYPTDAEEGLHLVDMADRAMYLGKQQGGNRVCSVPKDQDTTAQSTDGQT